MSVLGFSSALVWPASCLLIKPSGPAKDHKMQGFNFDIHPGRDGIGKKYIFIKFFLTYKVQTYTLHRIPFAESISSRTYRMSKITHRYLQVILRGQKATNPQEFMENFTKNFGKFIEDFIENL